MHILYARIFLPFSNLWMTFSLLKTLFPKFYSLTCSSLHPKAEEAKYSEPMVVECAQKRRILPLVFSVAEKERRN